MGVVGTLILIAITTIAIIIYLAKTKTEINLEKKHWIETWKLIMIFIGGIIVGLWMPW